MWKKLVAVVIGVAVGYWFLDDFDADAVRGKAVLVTGASTGIGEQLAYHYTQLGASVVVTARRENRLKEVVAKCKELGSEGQTFDYVVADMADLDSTKSVIEATVTKLGRLDILVLNHIILLEMGFWEGNAKNLSVVDKVFRVNFQSYVYLASHSLHHLEATHGSILVVSSLAGRFAPPCSSVYAATKYALDGFFSSLRQELMIKKSKIAITQCVLGLIDTVNAINNIVTSGQGSILQRVSPASPSDTALAIIKGGASRVREMYYPRLQAQSMVLFRDWFRGTLEQRMMFVYSPV